MIYNMISRTLYNFDKLIDKEEKRITLFKDLIKNRSNIIDYNSFISIDEEGIDSYQVQISNVLKVLFDLEDKSDGHIVVVCSPERINVIEVVTMDNKISLLQFKKEFINFSNIISRFSIPKDNVEEAIDILSDNQRPQITFVCPILVKDNGENLFSIASL